MKRTIRFLRNNSYLLIGLCLGLLIPSNFDRCPYEDPDTEFRAFEAVEAVLRAQQNLTRRQVEANPYRPRYYSTELGIREKLFVGVLTSEDRLLTQAVPVNRTLGGSVDRTRFFITAKENFKVRFNFSGIVGFTDSRRAFRPFQIIKYLSDNSDEYDFYYLIKDFNYSDGKKLKEIVERISVSDDVYSGTRIESSSYCDLDAGILFSNSVIKAIKNNLDWCIKNLVSDDDSENVGRCVYHSTKLNCQIKIIDSFKLKHSDLNRNLLNLSEQLKKSVSVYPILNPSDFYILHSFYSREHLKKIEKEIKTLSGLMDSWPPGFRPGTHPATRFDLPDTIYFNQTHNFFPNHFENVRKFTESESKDLQRIIATIQKKIPTHLRFKHLINGYKTFQLSRGLDYKLDLDFVDLSTGKSILKRFEVSKPLGNVEFLSKPFTSETTKVNIIIPMEENQIDSGLEFLDYMISTITDKREKVNLMLVLLYKIDSPSKGQSDVYKKIKETAIELSRRYHSDDTKASWISIRLPRNDVNLDGFPMLRFGIVDLALRKFGLDSLVLYLDVYARITVEFLNRVRMNTIPDFQIFSPIPFRQYDPEFSNINRLDVSKNSGHFDREEYGYVSFYSRDYIKARKLLDSKLPIVRSDNDILSIIEGDTSSLDGNIFEMFVKYSDRKIHKMRATDPALYLKHRNLRYSTRRRNLFLGNKAQLAKVVLESHNAF